MIFNDFLKDSTSPIHIYTDGACSGNPGDGGYGVYMEDANSKVFELSGGEANTTNNRMEMLAAIMALECFSHVTTEISLVLHTDSQYLKNSINTWIAGWKRNDWKTAAKQSVKNQDLWVRLDAINSRLHPLWKWVPAHSDIFGNERADALARNAIIALRLGACS